jgi:hypothetical protein
MRRGENGEGRIEEKEKERGRRSEVVRESKWYYLRSLIFLIRFFGGDLELFIIFLIFYFYLCL